MNRAIKYSRNGAIILGLGNGLLNLINQLNKMEVDPGGKFNWKEFGNAAAKGAFWGGVSGLAIGAISDIRSSFEQPINTDQYLRDVIDSVKLDKSDLAYVALNQYAEATTKFLKTTFSNQLAKEPIRLGSTQHGTALADNFDIDIGLPFKPNSFTSTEAMFSAVYDSLGLFVNTTPFVRIREQRKSIGLTFKVNGLEKRIDIVPYKLTSISRNSTSGYLYINNPRKPSYTKTDLDILNGLHLTETQKRIIIVLKHWKQMNQVPLSSHLLQQFVIDAYLRNSVPRGFTDKVLMVLKHIRDHIGHSVIRGKENSNNILTEMPDGKKARIIKACSRAISEYEYHPNSLADFMSP